VKKEIADKLVKALRSGLFEQGSGSLCQDGKYCCLGVLCVIAESEGVISSVESNVEMYPLHKRKFGTDLEPSYLPVEVMEWAGCNTRQGIFKDTNYLNSRSHLASENDSGKSFDQIATLIEKYWEEL